MATGTLEQRAAESRRRARAGANGPPSRQTINRDLRQGGARRVAATATLGVGGRMFAAGGHKAAQHALQEDTGMSAGQARKVEGAGRFRRGEGIALLAGAGGMALAGGALLPVAAVAGLGMAVHHWGKSHQMHVAQQQVSRVQRRNVVPLPRHRPAAAAMGTPAGRSRGGQSIAA